MSLWDNQLLTEADLQAKQAEKAPTIRKVSKTGKRYTGRHRPWWQILGAGSADKQCHDCAFLVEHRSGKTYFKCGQQAITRGPSTDIGARDPACQLFEQETKERA